MVNMGFDSDSGVVSTRSDCPVVELVHNRETSFQRIEASGQDPIRTPHPRDQNRTVFSVYVLQGECAVSSPVERLLILKSGQNALFRMSAGTDFLVTPENAGRLVAMVFQFSDAYLLRHCPENCPNLDRLPCANDKCVSQLLGATSPLVTTDEQHALVDQIWSTSLPEHLKSVYRDVKIAELLVLQLCAMLYGTKPKDETGLREHELQRVYKVRDILRNDPGKPYTLLGLAHEVGTNDATLKKHFKQVFGCTVFAYLNACRMAKAKEMLVEERKSVAETAQCLGYKHVSHFSASFRKYFGSAPTKFLDRE